jgi:hypothetical protein
METSNNHIQDGESSGKYAKRFYIAPSGCGIYSYIMLYRTETLHSAHRVHGCVSYGSHNK